MDLNVEALIQQAGPVGATAALLLLIFYGLARAKGWTGFGDKSKMVETSAVEKIDRRLGTIEKRLTDVEQDLHQRPTRQEIHELEKALARQDERIKSVDRTVTATNAAVSRIESFLIDLARKGAS